MHYFEGVVWFELRQNVAFLECNEFLNRYISLVMLNDSYLKEIHGRSGFKPYVFSLPYPPDKVKKIYRAKEKYRFTIRSVDERFLKMLLFELQAHRGLGFEVLKVDFFKVNQSYIESLHNISPAVLTLEGGRKWTLKEGDIELVKNRIVSNLARKYRYFFDDNLHEHKNAISYFELLNQTPYPIRYKKRTLLSNKFKISFNEDEFSQKLAFTCMALGMLEKNPLGFGFCVAKKVKELQGLIRW